MFERYTEKARRVIFFARYEACQVGSPHIETEHLLLGLLREDKALAGQFLQSHSAVEGLRRQIEQGCTVREKLATSVDLPLSHESKRVLAFGAEESHRLGQKHIGTLHLLAGLLREEKCRAASLLSERGVELPAVRDELGRDSDETGGSPLAVKVEGRLQLTGKLWAEVSHQAESHGVDPQKHLHSLVEMALHQTQPPAGDLMETYLKLRVLIEAEGAPHLDATELDEEIARRKGVKP